MCGIHGISWQDLSLVERMIAAAHHRGPDGNGHYFDEHITLGHNLLNITEAVENSTQPVVTNGNVLTYNGEIYNYRELRGLLTQFGYEFETDCDTEVLAKGLDRFGIDFIPMLDGMYAFGWYDRRSLTLTLARDCSGIKPLYFAQTDRGYAFSSEIKPLRLVADFSRIDGLGFQLFYKMGCNPGYRTLFAGISKLAPGEIIQISLPENREISSINLNDLELPPIETYDEEELRNNIAKSVGKCLMGRREIGLFLSGGMDSSMVFAEAVNQSAKTRSFSQAFDCQDDYAAFLNEDNECAMELARQFGAEHNAMIVNVDQYASAFRQSVRVIEEPRANMGTPSYLLMNKFIAGHGITVTLSGDGGDELMAGYPHHRDALNHASGNVYAAWLARIRTYSASLNAVREPGLRISEDALVDYMDSWFPKNSLGADQMNNLLMLDSLVNMSEDFLLRNDKLGMHFSMEGRFPLLVNDIKNYARAMPSRLKYSPEFLTDNWSSNSKFRFRDAYRNILPDHIINKRKSGWASPIADWLRRPMLMDFIVETVCSSNMRFLFGVENADAVTEMTRTPGRYRELFIMLYFIIWADEFGMSF